MTEDKRIPVDIKSAVGAIMNDLSRLEAMSPAELAKRGTFYSLL